MHNIQNMRSAFLKCFLATLLLLIAAVPTPAQALTVNDVRIGLHSDKTRIVFELDEISRFRTFVLEDPWRLVIDLPAFDWRAGRISMPEGSFVRDIRQGTLQPGFSRVVIDLTHPVSISSAFLLRADQGRPDRLVVDFKRISAGAFAQEKGRTLGLLEVGAAPPVSAAAPSKQQQQQEQQTAAIAPDAMVPQRKPGSSAAPQRETQPAPAATSRKPLIILDPGHGGIDPGAIGANGAFEKHITLAMAQELKKQLEATGRYEVKLTRTSDKYLKLYQRVEFARKHQGDLFISLHADSIGRGNVRGASIYTLSEKASDEQTARLAERENRADIIAGADLSHEDEQVANILIGLAMRDTMNQSNFFAETVVARMRGEGVRVLETPHRSAAFAVLKAPDIPSVLVELGFMSNRAEADQLSRPEYRGQIARALRAGIDAYFEQVRKNQRI